jgi:hypothetical protein
MVVLIVSLAFIAVGVPEIWHIEPYYLEQKPGLVKLRALNYAVPIATAAGVWLTIARANRRSTAKPLPWLAMLGLGLITWMVSSALWLIPALVLEMIHVNMP